MILNIILISGAANLGGVITTTFIKQILPSFGAAYYTEYYYGNGKDADKPFNGQAHSDYTPNSESKPQKISSAHFFHNNTPVKLQLLYTMMKKINRYLKQAELHRFQILFLQYHFCTHYFAL